MDLETAKIDENTPEFEVTDTRYTAMRLKCVFKLWPYVQEALNSPWSNIRSICYGLICSMLKVDVRDCNKYMPALPDQGEESKKENEEARFAKEFEDQDKELLEKNKFYQKLRQYVIPMMLNLLSSKVRVEGGWPQHPGLHLRAQLRLLEGQDLQESGLLQEEL